MKNLQWNLLTLLEHECFADGRSDCRVFKNIFRAINLDCLVNFLIINLNFSLLKTMADGRRRKLNHSTHRSQPSLDQQFLSSDKVSWKTSELQFEEFQFNLTQSFSKNPHREGEWMSSASIDSLELYWIQLPPPVGASFLPKKPASRASPAAWTSEVSSMNNLNPLSFYISSQNLCFRASSEPIFWKSRVAL